MKSQSAKAEEARQRALMILQVQAGKKTAMEAAEELGVSRQSYHQWEKRAMQALLQAVEERPSGRPAQEEDPQARQSAERILELEHKLRVTEEIADLRGSLLRRIEEEERAKSAQPRIKKKKTESEKSCNEPRE